MRVFSDSRVIHLVSSSRERIMGTGRGEARGGSEGKGRTKLGGYLQIIHTLWLLGENVFLLSCSLLC